LNLLGFRTRYPEFDPTSESLVQAALDEAALSVDATVYGGKYDAAHGALAAHLLWSGAFGTTTRLDGDKEPESKSRYWQEFVRIRREVAPRMLVV
jgi:hypothetical protein